jgi:hypothetical protein
MSDENEAAESGSGHIADIDLADGLPRFPFEIQMFAGSAWWIKKYADGRVSMKIAPTIQAAPGQMIPVAPAVHVGFSVEGWERFKRDVASDGAVLPQVEISRVIPSNLN